MSTQVEKIIVKKYDTSKNNDLKNKNNNTSNIDNITKVQDVSFTEDYSPKQYSSSQKDKEKIKYIKQEKFTHEFGYQENQYIDYVESDLMSSKDSDNYFHGEDAISINIRNDRYEIQKIKDEDGDVVETKILDLSNNKKYYYDKNKQLCRIETFAVKPGMEPKFNKDKSAEKTYLILNFYEEYDIKLNKYSMGTIHNDEKRVVRQYITPYTDGRNATEYISLAMQSIHSDNESISSINSDYEFYRNSKFEIRKIKSQGGITLETQILDLRNNKKYYYNKNKEIYCIDTYALKPGVEAKFNKNKSAEDDYLLFNYSMVSDEDRMFHRVIKKNTLYRSEGSKNYLNSVRNSFGNNLKWQIDEVNKCASLSNEKYEYKSYLDFSNKVYRYEIVDKVKNIKYYYNKKEQLYRIDNNNDNSHIEFSDFQVTVENAKSKETYNYSFGKSSDGKEYMVMGNDVSKFYYSKDKYEIYDSNTGKCKEKFFKTSDNKIVHYVYGENSGNGNTDTIKNSYTEVFTENGGYCRESYFVDANDLNNLKFSDLSDQSIYNYYNGKFDILPTIN